ncbi:GroES-like protein [Nemania sp. NC0429]|nr:GroES-like protein [Nemania sp. NC0429]
MRALRYHGPYDVRLEYDTPEPECLPHQVKIRPAFCGICGSDLAAYTSPESLPFKDKPHPLTGETWPITLGHEFSGEIEELGSQVQAGLKPGDRVVVQPTICCNQCTPCKEGATNCCYNFGFIGLMGWGGGLSDFACIDARFVFKLPDTIPLEIGALVEPLAVAWHAVDQAKIKPGINAIVLGAGPIGLAVVQILKMKEAKQIIVIEMASQRKEMAMNFGATTVLDPREDDPVSGSKALCDGEGPEVAFDCAGTSASIKNACLAIQNKGLVVNVAVWKQDVPFHFNNIVFGEKTIYAALSYTSRDFESVIRALDGGLPSVREMITGKTTMNRAVEDGICALLNEKEKERHIKILVDVRAQ